MTVGYCRVVGASMCGVLLLAAGCSAAKIAAHDASLPSQDAPMGADAGDPADAASAVDMGDAPPALDVPTQPPVDADAPMNDGAPGDTGSTTTDAGPSADAPAPSGVRVFVAVGYDPAAASAPRVATSCDGQVWKNQTVSLPPGSWTDPETNGLRGLGFGAGRFVAVGGGTGAGNVNARRLYVSTDAVTWVHENQAYECTGGGTCNSSSVCTSCQFMGDVAWLDDGTTNGLWVMGGGNADRRYSTDAGVTWKRLPVGTVGQYRRLASAAGVGAATADDGVSVIRAAPGQNPPVVWTDQAMADITEPSLAVSGVGTIVAVWWDTDCHYFSSNAWHACTLPRAPAAITSVVHDGNFRVLGRDPPYVSTDGMTYTQPTTTAGSDFRQVRFSGGVYVAPDIKRWSTDGVRWQTMPTPPNFTVTDVEVGMLAACP